MKAAWDLFAEKGFEAVSVRDVTNAANVNLASVSYHFGGKEGLIQETVKLCMNPINQYRLKLLAESISKHGSLDKIPEEEIMAALLRPAVMPEECGVAAGLMLRLVARYFIESDYAIPTVSRNLYTEVFQSFAKAFSYHHPDLAMETIVKRIVFVSGSVIYFLGLGRLAGQLSSGAQPGEKSEIDREAMLKEVITFGMHGFGGKD
ncbi:MAG: TetR family transcriptional regulator [Akkermansiaceae bacterium]